MVETMQPDNVGTEAGFGAGDFVATAAKYSDNRGLVDAIVKIEKKDRKAAVEAAYEVIGLLETMSDKGACYNPPAALGFGSDHAGTIARTILGLRASASKVRSIFAKIGKV